MTGDDKFVTKMIALVVACVVALGIGLWLGISALHRWNAVQGALNEAHVARIHASNQTSVNQLLIAANEQQVKIHEQQAGIRVADAVGIREAQDEISKTLTPLYVQFEMVQALEKMAESGKNNTLELIPSGAGGIPLIANVAPGSPQDRVTAP